MKNETLTTMLIAIILVMAVVQTLQVSGISNSLVKDVTTSSSKAASSTGALDTTGWTADEIMNYEMHGIIPARASSGAPVAYPTSAPTMVGGC